MNAPLTPQDWEFLSTYLDGQMSLVEQRRAREVLARRTELVSALEALRRTRAVLRAAPRRRAPRNFTLTPAMARQARRRFGFTLGWVPSLSFASAMAVLLLVLSFFVRLPGAGLPAAPLAAPMAQAPIMAQADRTLQDKSAPNEASVPPVILGNGDGRNAGSDTTLQPGDRTPPQPLTQENLSVPPAAGTTDVNPTVPSPTAAPKAAAALASGAADSTPTASRPMLGMAPTDEPARMLAVTPVITNTAPPLTASETPPAVSALPPAGSTPVEAQDNLQWVQMGLGLAALLSGLAAFAVWRRARH